MCQFTDRDKVQRHRPGTVCPFTKEVAGSDGGCGGAVILLLLLLAVGFAAGGGIVPLP